MATETLQNVIDRKKATLNAGVVAQKEAESKALEAIIDRMAKDKKLRGQIQTGSFSKKEVIAAAKFALKASPYDISVRNLKVSDSPIYYDLNKKSSRWKMTRKKLDDKGQHLIEQAKEIRRQELEREKQQELIRQQALEREQESLRNQRLDEIAANTRLNPNFDLNEVLPEKELGDQAEKRDVSAYDSTKIFDRVMNTGGFADQLDRFYDKNHETSYMDPESQAYYIDTVDQALKETLVPIKEYYNRIDQNLIKHINGARVGGKHPVTEEELSEQSRSLMKDANENLNKIRGLYDEVKAGRLDPVVLKLYLNMPVMAGRTRKEDKLYDQLIDNNTQYAPTKEETKEARDTFVKGVPNELYKDNMIILQENRQFYSVRNYISYARDKGKIRGRIDTDEEAREAAFKANTGFVHFKGNPDMKESTNRYYVTCKPEKYSAMLKAWWSAFSEMSPDFHKRVYFKMPSKIKPKRQDNVVIYIQKNQNMGELHAFLESFRKKCGDDILADEQNTLKTGKLRSPGISTGVEPNVKTLNMMIENNLYDKKGYEDMYRNAMPHANAIPYKIKFSYNTYVTKALVLSAAIAKKKAGLSAEEKISDHPELKESMKRYFADFMRLAGADPETMEPVKENSGEAA